MSVEKVRRGLLLKTAMEILRDHSGKTQPAIVLEEIRRRLALTPRELSLDNSGLPRYDRAVGFETAFAATVGWASKIGGWSITEAGIEALETYLDPDDLHAELARLWREIDQRRKKALESLSDVDQFIAKALQLVEPGEWTAHDDLAQLADTSPEQVADFLAGTRVTLPNSYRVLLADGSIPPKEFLPGAHRSTDLRQRLATEGVTFDGSGKASQRQRTTVDALKVKLTELAEDSESDGLSVQRAWMVRGTNIDGYNLVPDWLGGGFVSLSATQLGQLDAGISFDALRQAVETAYQHKSYAYRGQRLEELDRFIRRMSVGDLVLTPMQGSVYLGEVASGPRFDDEGTLAGYRRTVTWHDPGHPVDVSELPVPVPALLQGQAYVVDLTEAYGQLAALVPGKPTESAAFVREIEKEQRTLGFHRVTEEAARKLNMDPAGLQKIADLLWERKQVIFYGPPGTGKTYLAKALARQLTEDGAVRLVQFHPSYTYEDFFEGFRPKSAEGGTGALTFELTPGPFRLFAEAAKDNPTTPYILIIDEINRANLAKVFGELYFLLEYREEAIALQYSPKDEFTLPENLFVIGTMNTADRSIARIDAAMRRRFAFIELDPRIPPVQGLLSRWLAAKELPSEGALILDALNARLSEADPDAAIGPSYLMRPSVHDRADGLDRVWEYEIMPLLADLFYGQRDLAERYGLAALRRAAGIAAPTGAPAQSEADSPDSPLP